MVRVRTRVSHLGQPLAEGLHVAAAVRAAQLAAESRRPPARVPPLAAVRAEGGGERDAHLVRVRVRARVWVGVGVRVRVRVRVGVGVGVGVRVRVRVS